MDSWRSTAVARLLAEEPLAEVAERLGLAPRRFRDWVRFDCPSCRRSDGWARPEGTHWRCRSCGSRGDTADLVVAGVDEFAPGAAGRALLRLGGILFG